MSDVSILDLLEVLSDEGTTADSPLVKATRSFMNSWPNQPTYMNHLRASGMYFMCPREFVLNYWRPEANRSFDGISILKMRMGTDFHAFMQDHVLGPLGILFGHWSNSHTGDVVEGFHPDPGQTLWEIREQVSPTWTFVEPELWSEQWRIKGHCDGNVCLDRLTIAKGVPFKKDMHEALERIMDSTVVGETALLEMKSVASYGFKKLTTVEDIPAYYKMQACVYMFLSGYKKTVFLFAERDQFKMKSFVYDYEPKWWMDAKRKARIVWTAIRDRTMPEAAMACVSPADKRAKGCVFRSPCFDRKVDWNKWIEESIAMQPDRKWLDLSDWEV